MFHSFNYFGIFIYYYLVSVSFESLLESVAFRKQMGSEGLQAAKVYRHLLKAVKKHIGKEEHKRHFSDFINQEFHKVSDPSTAQRKIMLAHNYSYLLNSVHHHKELLFSYNIAVDRSDEVKRTLNKSAASVGLQLPEVYQP
ncbi:hypothetical protein IFM89_030098 [Coptis chinensis]|uniref:Uncharacterized protein n=1 Tax=Coptis chinensis TaxID=261450 RepID=A0A835LVV3_9MAGN|nr:hypothetical protein IFM89_030098 [Coptis chinensis]